jgi:hypothetical protein
MADIAWSDVTAFASGLSAVDADAQTLILGYVNDVYDASLFGGEDSFEYKLLRIMLAAHIASSATEDGSGGTSGGGLVAGETLGKISRTFTYANIQASASDSGLQTTGYGRQVRAMIRSSPARVGFAF